MTSFLLRGISQFYKFSTTYACKRIPRLCHSSTFMYNMRYWFICQYYFGFDDIITITTGNIEMWRHLFLHLVGVHPFLFIRYRLKYFS